MAPVRTGNSKKLPSKTKSRQEPPRPLRTKRTTNRKEAVKVREGAETEKSTGDILGEGEKVVEKKKREGKLQRSDSTLASKTLVKSTESTPAEAGLKSRTKPPRQQADIDLSPSSIARDKITVEVEGDDDADEEEVLLQGFSSESDSSDEDDGVDDAPIDVAKLPTVARDDLSVKLKLEKAKRQPSENTGVIYLGRIPHGFYEDQMRSYFNQFGDVTRLRLSRNKTTGRSKHYGFIEFSSSAVADIVAETMDNYLLMSHILRCKVIPKDEVHPELWIGANRKWRRVPNDRIARLQQNKARTGEDQEKVERRLLKRQEQKKRKLEKAKIDYDLEPVAYSKRSKPSAE